MQSLLQRPPAYSRVRRTCLDLVVCLALIGAAAGFWGGARSNAASTNAAHGWIGVSARDEIRPTFQVRRDPESTNNVVLRISADNREGLDGHWTKSFPVQGGRFYRFEAWRRVDNAASPERSALARILWKDAQGRAVKHDAPGAFSYAPGRPPIAEPEYPNDGAADGSGKVPVTGIYKAPQEAAAAVVELHFRWAPNAAVEWSRVTWRETAPPPTRKVRLATIHYVPKNGKTAYDSCRQFEPLLAIAAEKKADLAVLPETLTATGNGLSYF